MAILRTIVWFFYFFGALIVLTPKMNEAKRRKAAGDESGCRAIVDRYVPMWMSTLMYRYGERAGKHSEGPGRGIHAQPPERL